MRDKTGSKIKKASPVDFFKSSTEYVSDEVSAERYAECESCKYFIQLTKQCRKCGCFMHIKTKLSHAECPIGKW